MNPRPPNRGAEIPSLLIAPDRDLAGQLAASVTVTRAFQVVADLKSYPPQQTLDMRLRQLHPALLLLDVATDLDAACALIQFAVNAAPDLHVVALHRNADPDAILRALRAGASEFLYAPFDSSMQDEAIGRLLRLRPPDKEAERESGSVVVFSSVKPGSGASTLAAQTAFSLKRLTGKRVLLADFDLTGGTVAFYLKISHGHSLVDALAHADSLDPVTWSSFVVNSGGLDILGAPATPYADPVDPGRLHAVLDFARTMYDWVVIDLPSIFQRLSLITLSQCERAFLVSTSELPSLHLARRGISMLDQLGFPKERFQVTVNRVSRRDGISTGDMEKLFNCPVHASFPNDYFSLHRVVTLGQPLTGDCDLGRAIEGMASRIAGVPLNGKRNGTRVADTKLAFSVL